MHGTTSLKKYIFSFCVSAKRLGRITLSSVACPAVLHLPTWSHKRHDFREKISNNKICILILPTTFASNISHSKKNSERYYHKRSQVFMYNAPYSCHILKKRICLTCFRKVLKYQISWKTVLWEPKSSMRKVDGWTDGRAGRSTWRS